uniref:DUF7041 domain-containing protein n=1 Tax=Heliothis virescens TaxID=7102 RepID=A0A2A4IXB7_HELVI
MATGDDNATHLEPTSEELAPFPTIAETIFANTVTMPPFWPDMPAVWFATLEAIFRNHQITREDTKYFFIVGQLDLKTATEVEDIIMEKPKEQPYLKLKQALISRFTETDMNKIRFRLETEKIDGRKPSLFLRRLKVLAGASFPEEELKNIWLKSIPPERRIYLFCRPMSLDEMGEAADKIYDIL